MGYFEGLFDDEDSGTSRKKRRTDSPEDAVRRVAADRGYNPDFLLGLAQLETRGGAATIKSGGQDTNNLFNVKDFSRAGTGLRGFDKAEGSNDRYRQYASYDESAEDLIGLLDRKYPGAREAQDPVQFAQALKDGGYATDPDYVDKLSRTISSRSKSAAPAARAADPSGYFADLPDDLASALSPPQRRAPAKEPVADKPWWDDAKAVGGQIAAGFVVDAPRMVGQALRFVSPDGSVLDEAGRSAVDAADARAPNWEPDYEGRGALAKTAMMGGRGIGPMTGAIAATMAGGPLAGGAAAAAQFGLGSAQDTHDKITLQGGTEEAAMAAALRVGAVQGLGEGAAAAVGGMALKGLRPLLGGAGATTASVASRMTDTAILKPLAKGMGLNLLVQPSTEVGQDVSTEFIERAYGAAPEDAWQIAKDSAQGGLGLTLLLGPFAAGGQIRRAQRAEQIKQALYDPNTPDAVRAQVRDMVVQAAAQDGVAAENSDAWLDEQFAAEDAARAQGELADARRSARTYETRNRQDTNEIIELARQQVAPLGEVPDSPTAGVATPQAAEAIQQNQAAALAQQEVEAAQDQEQRAIVETARAEEAEAAKTPQQRAMEQAQAETEALNQQAQALAVEYGVQEVKAAPNVIKEMLRAGDAVSPELAGQVIGELKAGDAPAARKVVVQAIKAREKAQADANKARIKAETEARKAQEKAQKAEQKIVEEGQKAEQANDDYAASVVATRQPEAQVENSVVQNPPQPSPAPQGTPAVSQPAAQAPVVGAQPTGPAPGVPAARPAAVEAAGVTPAEKTPGQKLVEALEARAGKPIPEKVRRRLFLLAGLDPDQGFMVGSPRTLDQVAAIEAAMAGSSRAVSREAIRKSLAPYGINKEAMDRLGGMVQSEESASNTEVDEEGALVETVAPEDNTPATQDEAFGAATEDNRGGTSSMQVRSNLGSGIVEPELTREQKTAALGADKLLAAAAGAITKRGADAIERVKAAVAEATTPVVSAEQIAKNAEIIAANEKLIDELNAEIDKSGSLNTLLDHPALIAEVDRAKDEWSKIGVPADGDLTWADLPAAQQAEWVRAFARWDSVVDSDSVYYHNFSEINDAARKTVARRAQGKDTTRVGAGDQNNGERQGSGQDSVAAGAGGNEGRAPAAVGADNQGDGGERNAAGGTTESEVVVGKPDTNVAVTTKKRRTAVKQSRSEADVGSDAAALESELADFVRADSLGRNVVVVQTLEDLPENVRRSEGVDGRTQAFVKDHKAYLIADNIAPGQARAVFLHDVGSHLGLEGLLDRERMGKLIGQLKKWESQDGTLESQLAKRARKRVESAETNADDADSELLAYFVEEAVDAGVNPSAAKGPLRQWFRELWAAFKSAVRRLGMNPDKLTAQDVVDLAYGAARLEVAGTRHGTAAIFRRFDHAFMNSGEGAQAYGWGTYLAQRYGVADGYWKADVKRKVKGGFWVFADGKTPVMEPALERELSEMMETRGGVDMDALLTLQRVHQEMLDGWRTNPAAGETPRTMQMLTRAEEYFLTELGDAIKSGGVQYNPVTRPDGALMRVDTSVPQSEMLDWDEPLSQQPKVMAKLEAALSEDLRQELEERANAELGEMTGGDIYKGLTSMERRDGRLGEEFEAEDYNARLASADPKKVVSVWLDEKAGIGGVKLLDANSRSVAPQLVFRGKPVIRDNILQAARTADTATPEGLEAYILRRVLGPDRLREFRAEAQRLVDKNTDMFFGIDRDSAARYRGPFDAEAARAKAEQDARNTVEGRALAWLDANEKHLKYVKPDVTRNLVIFNDKNITRVASNIGNERGRVKFSKKANTLPGQLDKSGQVVGVVSKTLADMERTPSVKEVLDRYRKRGLEHVLDTVQDWYTTSSKVDWSGAYTTVDGRTAMVLPIRTLLFPSMVEQTIDHEIGHAVDLIEAGGLFSGLPEFNLRIAGDKVRAHGDVANELVSHFETEPTSQLSQLLKYPLDRTKYGDLDAQAIREELFAQVWSAWGTPMGRDFIVDNLPDTAYFMEKVDEEIRQDEYRAKVVALSANGGAQASPGPVRFNRAQAVLPPSAARGAGDAASVLRAGQQQVALSRTPKASQVQRAIAQLPQATRAPVRISMETLGGWANKALDRVVFTGDLIDRAVTQGMKAAKKLESVLANRAHAVRELEYKVSGIMDMYARVPDADRGNGPNSLNQFLFDSTRSSKWGYGKDADPEMAERFEKLSPESQDLVRAIFDHGAQVLADKKKMVLEYTAHEYDAEIAYAKANPDVVSAKDLANLRASKEADLAKFKTLFALREGKPYAPIKRLGTHAVVAKSTEYREAEENADGKRLRELEQDDNHYHVTFVESAHQGRLLRERLLNEGFFGDDPNAVGLFERDKFSDELFGGESMLGALTKLRTKVDSAAGADAGDAKVAAARAKMRTMVSELYLQALAEGSARKSEMRRRGIAGEVDMLRSFAHQGRADATFMASVVSNPQAQEAIQAMREQSRRNGDTLRKTELFNEIMARYLGTMEVEHSPLLNKLTRLTSIWFLATSPGYYLQNLTQPWMMSLPAMAGRFGWGKSSSALWKAYSELSPVMKGIGLFDQHFDFTKVSEKYRPAILELARRGRLDIGMETEMGEFRMEGHGAFTDRWNKVDKGMRLMVQKGEAINRLSTAVAAYELYTENNPNAKYEDAVNYAERVLTDTHGNYDRFSAPRAFNNKLGKVMLQFRKFQLVQLSFYGRLINDAWQGKDRAMAIKTMAYSLLHTGAMAGVMGLPGYAAVAWAMGMMAGDDDEKFDLTYELRKMIGDEALATMILRGAPAAGGVDLSGKIGSGNMLSAMPFSDADITNPKGAAETLGTAVGGASLGLASRVLDGIGLMMAGDWYKGVERTMPKGISDAMAAYRVASDGMTRRNGDVILPAEDMAEVSAIVKALGLMPTKQAVVYERRDRAFKTEEHLKNRSTRIKNEYIKAVKDGDAAGRTEAMDAWRKLQETRRESGFRIQPMSDLIKAPMAQAKRERDTRNGVQFNRSSRGYAEEMTEQ